MSWHIHWMAAAERDLREIHWETAARIDAAVLVFAATGRGRLDRRRTEPLHRRLLADGGQAVIFIDAATRTIHVVRAIAHR